MTKDAVGQDAFAKWKKAEIAKSHRVIGELEARLLSAYNRLKALRRVRRPK